MGHGGAGGGKPVGVEAGAGGAKSSGGTSSKGGVGGNDAIGDSGEGGEGGEGGDVSAQGGVGGVGGGSTTDCAADEFKAGASCKKLTICVTGEYQKTPPTAESDRLCAPWSVCGAGTYVSTQPTATGDRACAPCAAGKFSGAVNAAQCTTWSQCASGETESVAPTLTSDRVCSKCGAGKYESAGQCLSLTACTSSQYESTAATASSDRKCSALTSCQPGSAQTAAPTSVTDRQCAACSSGQFSTQVNSTSCKAWTVCSATQNQTMAGSSTSDVVCVDKPVCSTATDRTCTTQCPCASGEGVCTANNQCASGATCVAGSGKKVGRTGDTCLATHCNNDQIDSTETSVDCGGECGCRATFEALSFKAVPANRRIGNIVTMSRDGKRFAGYLFSGFTQYPATFAYDGTVTELESYGKGGNATAMNSDGSVTLGYISCADPPACTNASNSNARWSGTAAPSLYTFIGYVRAASSSASIMAGDQSESSSAFIYGTTRTLIPELWSVVAMTPDGKNVAGQLQSTSQAGLWNAQTQVVTKIGVGKWDSTQIAHANGTDPAVVGFGQNSGYSAATGFRWKGGVITELGFLPGDTSTVARAVSSDGSTVVGYGANDATYQQAVIWTDSNKLRTIIDELKARGYEPPADLELAGADFISDDGKTIVGLVHGSDLSFWRVVLQ